jgi:teichuronic acid biosynthesis glycosyltransferase TuaC
MHVLVIPSEEFQPPESHLAGIFQRHQCTAMHRAGWKVSVLSVRLQFSTVMILKAFLMRLFGRVARRGLAGYSAFGLLRLLKEKWWQPEKFVTHEVLDGYPVVRINGLYVRRPSPKTDHLSWVRAGKVGFAEFVRTYGKPDLIHVHNCNPAGLLAQEIQKQTGIPYMITEHSSYYHRQLIPQQLMPRLREAFVSAKLIGVVSPALGESLIREVGPQLQNYQWIPNVIDPALESLAPPERCQSAGFQLLSIGELIPLKGHRELIAAFAKAFAGQPDVTLRIAGDGALDIELRQLIVSMQLTGQVQLVGRLTRTQVQNEIRACHCLVLPSHFETFGVVLIEALVQGRPIIASACGGPNCIVDESNGMLVPPKDVDALAHTLATMRQTHATKYDPVALQQNVLVRFGQSRLLRELHAAYQNCLC